MTGTKICIATPKILSFLLLTLMILLKIGFSYDYFKLRDDNTFCNRQ